MEWCLPVALLLLAVGIGAVVMLWMAYGFLAVAGAIVGLYLALWVLSRILPVVSRNVFKGVFDQFAGPMKDARVDVHSVRFVDESSRLKDDVARVDEWLRQQEDEESGLPLHFDAGEAFYAEGHPSEMLESYVIELTIAPPEQETSWTPHGLGFRPVSEPTVGASEILEFRIARGPTDEFELFEPENLFEELTGQRRLQLLVLLAAEYSEYTLEYLHADHWNTIVTLPPPPQELYVRRLTAGVIERLLHYPDLRHVALAGMPVTDADVSRLAALHKLESLDLTATAITDACATDLQTMSQLKHLTTAGTKLTPEAVQTLRKALPETSLRSDLVNPFE